MLLMLSPCLSLCLITPSVSLHPWERIRCLLSAHVSQTVGFSAWVWPQNWTTAKNHARSADTGAQGNLTWKDYPQIFSPCFSETLILSGFFYLCNDILLKHFFHSAQLVGSRFHGPGCSLTLLTSFSAEVLILRRILQFASL